MPNDSAITPQNFKLLLEWLDPDEEVAVHRYEQIRLRLINILQFRGCTDAESLANESIDRVTAKMPQIVGNYVGDPTLYFYGVAKLVLMEWRRKQSRQTLPMPPPARVDAESLETDHDCLNSCLADIPKQNRELLIAYYSYESSSAKAKHRVELAQKIGISQSALHIRAFRIRRVVGECIKNCLGR